jgi:ribose 5-phosphate isomerase B
MKDFNIYIGSDHAGFALKEYLRTTFKEKNFIDCGVHEETSANYAPVAHDVATKVENDPGSRAILICGTGIGVSITANRHSGIRAALCHNNVTAELARRHNNANILALGARVLDEKTAYECVRVFLTTSFEGGRHTDRLRSIDQERENN